MLAIVIIAVIVGIGAYIYCAFKSIGEADKRAKEKTKENEKGKYYDQLLELQRLKEKNIITEEEFEIQKEKLKHN